MVVAASVAGVFTDTVGQLSQAISDQGLDVSTDVRTDIEVISDSGSGAIYDSGSITLHVKNTGSETLGAEANVFDLFVDGQFATDVSVTLLADGGQWLPGDVVELDITRTLNSGDHRVKVIVDGDEEVFEFRS